MTVKERDFFDRGYKEYFARTFSPLLNKRLLELFPTEVKNSSDTLLVLDVACGLLQWGSIFSSKGHKVVGVDISRSVLKEAKSSQLGEFVVADMRKLPFRPSSFNVLICFYGLHHLPLTEISKAVSEFAYAVKKRGFVFTVDPSAYCPYNKPSVSNLVRCIAWPLVGPGHALSPEDKGLSPSILKRAFIASGFLNVKIVTMHLIPLYILERHKTLDALLGKLDLAMDKLPTHHVGSIVAIKAQKK